MASADDLIAALDALSGHKFAVVDAAHFDDLPGIRSAAEFSFRPLYRDEEGEDTEAAGPFLVPLPLRSSARQLLPLLEDKPAVVWWSWPDQGEDTEDRLYKHLRTINMAEIPVDRADNPDAGDDGGGLAEARAAIAQAAENPHDHDHGHGHGENGGHHQHDHGPPPDVPERYELVLFRHGDPNVMAMLLPILDRAQVSRLFGAATGLVVEAPDAGGIRSFPRPDPLPEKPRGWLRIRPEQYERLGATRIAMSRERVAGFLKRHLPEPLDHLSDDQIAAIVLESERTGKALGLRSERAHARWAYLMLLSNGRAAHTPEAKMFIKQGKDPDQRVKELIDHAALALRAGILM